MISVEKLYSVYVSANYQVSTDTRNIPKGSIFFALKGPNFNGNEFAEKAIQNGASYVVVDEEKYKTSEQHFLVEDSLMALQDLANFHRRQLKIPVLAVTGSNGKTTTKELLHAVLSKKFRTISTKGNLNNHIGVPLTILSIIPGTEFAVIEMGANHLLEIESYCRIAEPDYGLITNVGKAHLEGFGGFEGVKKGKGELYAWIGRNGKMIFINADNPILRQMSADYGVKNLFSYGTAAVADCTGELSGKSQGIFVKWACKGQDGKIDSKLIGQYNFENILSAVCVGNYFGVDASDIDQAISSYVPENNRSQIIVKNGNTIVLDAYNANPTSMEAALKNFSEIPNSKKVICLGEMAELGEESAKEHERIIDLLKKIPAEYVLLVGKNFKPFTSGVNSIYFEDSGKAKAWLLEHPFSNCTFLIKGSRSTKMEVLLEAFD